MTPGFSDDVELISGCHIMSRVKSFFLSVDHSERTNDQAICSPSHHLPTYMTVRALRLTAAVTTWNAGPPL